LALFATSSAARVTKTYPGVSKSDHKTPDSQNRIRIPQKSDSLISPFFEKSSLNFRNFSADCRFGSETCATSRIPRALHSLKKLLASFINAESSLHFFSCGPAFFISHKGTKVTKEQKKPLTKFNRKARMCKPTNEGCQTSPTLLYKVTV